MFQALGRLVIVAVLGIGDDGDQWSPEQVLSLLKAREDSVPAIEAVIAVEQGPSKKWSDYIANLESSNRAIAKLNQSYAIADSRDPAKMQWPTLYRRLLRDPIGRLRIEVLDSNGAGQYNATSVQVFNGARWFSADLVRDSGVIDGLETGAHVQRLGEALGIEVWVESTTIQPTTARTVYEVCSEWHRNGVWKSSRIVPWQGDTKALEVVMLRNTLHPRAAERGLFHEFTLWLDINRGLAPIKARNRDGIKHEGDVVFGGGSSIETIWLGHVEVRPGVWLSTTCQRSNFASLVFPASGSEFSAELGPLYTTADDHARIRAFREFARFEDWETAYTTITVIDYKIDPPLSDNTFTIDLRDGSHILDRTTGDRYQVGESSDAVDAALRGAVGQSSPSGRGYAFLAAVLIVPVMLLLAWSALRRFQRRPKSA